MDFTPTATPIRLAHGEFHACIDHSVELSLSTPDGRPLLSDLDLTFGAERAGLVGRNGVGKTTLLAAITGEHIPQAGASPPAEPWACSARTSSFLRAPR